MEVSLKGLGWIPFHPTPPETKTPDKSLDPTPPDPRTLVRQPPPPLADPPHDDHTTQGRTSVGGQEATPQSPPSFWKQHGPLITKTTLWTMPVWLPALPILLLLGIKTRLRRPAYMTGTHHDISFLLRFSHQITVIYSHGRHCLLAILTARKTR